jgi:hypothetical protein
MLMALREDTSQGSISTYGDRLACCFYLFEGEFSRREEDT